MFLFIVFGLVWYECLVISYVLVNVLSCLSLGWVIELRLGLVVIYILVNINGDG